jgi:TrmH family RNA methyltransferase
MAQKLITSTANPLIKRIRALEQRKHREEGGAFFVEGIRPVWQAVESGAQVEALVVAPELLTSEPARHLIQAQGAAGITVVRVTPKVFNRIAQREHPSGLGAIVHISSSTLNELVVATDSLFVALEETGNPGNLGTIIRTMDAVGGTGILLIGESTDPYHPAAVKASMGTLFNVPLVRVQEMDDVLDWCASKQVKVIAASSRATSLYWSVDYSLPLLFLFGSEGEGLRDETMARGDMAVRIPMAGTADSLNLAVSVGVLLYEVKRQTLKGLS